MLPLNQNLSSSFDVPINVTHSPGNSPPISNNVNQIPAPPFISSPEALLSESPLIPPDENSDLGSNINSGNKPPLLKKRSRLSYALVELCERAEIAAKDSKVYIISIYSFISRKDAINHFNSLSKSFKKIDSSKNRNKEVIIV